MNPRIVAVCALFALAVPTAASAHGGEDHGEQQPATATGDRAHSVGGTGDAFEVLVKYTPAPAGKPMALKLFVADAQTNEPMSGAALELTFTGKVELKVTPQATDSPGIYVASVTLPAEGDFDVVASVTHGEDADLVVLGQVHSGLLPVADAIPPHSHGPSIWAVVRIGLGLLVGVGLAIGIARVVRARRALKAQEVSNA